MTIDIDNVGDDVDDAIDRLSTFYERAAIEYNEEDNDDPELKQVIEDALLVSRTLAASIRDRDSMVMDLSTLVRRLSYCLRKVAPDHDLPDKADDYIKRKGLGGSILR